MNTALQKKWDRAMLVAWFDFQYCKVVNVVHNFEKDNNLERFSLLDRDDLVRLPKKWHVKRDFRTWVSGCIPALGTALMNTERDDVERRASILRRLLNGKTVALDNPKDRISKELSEVNDEVRRNLKRSNEVRANVNKLYASHRRSNQWSVCK